MKIVGYVLAVVGIIGIAIEMIPQLRAVVPLPAPLGGTVLLVISLVVALIGIFFIMQGPSGRGRQAPEVPIYRGKQIVGYRRMR